VDTAYNKSELNGDNRYNNQAILNMLAGKSYTATELQAEVKALTGMSRSTFYDSYPERFRRVSYRDPETGKALFFLTNNFGLPPLVIAQLYKTRWRVELFFKWIKQNRRIKHFFGTSDNAVKAQVWVTVWYGHVSWATTIAMDHSFWRYVSNQFCPRGTEPSTRRCFEIIHASDTVATSATHACP